MHTTFILDVFHREIVGWQVTNHMRESPARDALPMALVAKYRAGEAVSGLVHHRDRGIRFRSTRYVETLAESEIVASVGSRGDSYDNAMAEALISAYKVELVDRKVQWRLIETIAETRMSMLVRPVMTSRKLSSSSLPAGLQCRYGDTSHLPRRIRPFHGARRTSLLSGDQP